MKWSNIIGWLLFLFALGFFGMQLGYFFIAATFHAEYIDDRLFYIFNILCACCLAVAFFLLARLSKTVTLIGGSIVILFIISQTVMLLAGNKKVHNITSISPDYKHVLSIKENVLRGDAVYYRSYYKLLGRPKESLPQQTTGDFHVEWLVSDVAAVTYKTADDSIQQFVATYGDRGGGISYYHVGAEIQGIWGNDNTKVVSDPTGISVTAHGVTELFDWEDIHQFGTLAVVLEKDNEAVWTIALDDDFEVYADASQPVKGNILLYQATMENERAIQLAYQGIPGGETQ